MEHVVEPGEDLMAIALRYRFHSWSTIYDHPDNAELKARRPDPSQLHPGDVLIIPDPDGPKWVEGATEDRHTFRVKRHLLQVYVIDHAGEAIADTPCIVVADGQTIETCTAGDGLVSVGLLRRPEQVLLRVEDHEWQLRLGDLNPLRETEDDAVSGLQARLSNLGFDVGSLDGQMGPRTRACIRSFQRRRGLEPSGEVDDALLDALVEAHGS